MDWFGRELNVGLLEQLGLDFDARGNVKVDDKKQTSVEKIFAAGDAEKGASLVVHAIQAGKIAAENVDKFLRS